MSEITIDTMLADFRREITLPEQWIIQRWYHRSKTSDRWTYWDGGPALTVESQLASFRRHWGRVEAVKYRTDTIPATVTFTSVSVGPYGKERERRLWKLEIAPP